MQRLFETSSFDHVDYSPVTRIGFSEGIWLVGVIDEVRMPLTENGCNPIVIEIKTHSRHTLLLNRNKEMKFCLFFCPFISLRWDAGPCS